MLIFTLAERHFSELTPTSFTIFFGHVWPVFGWLGLHFMESTSIQILQIPGRRCICRDASLLSLLLIVTIVIAFFFIDIIIISIIITSITTIYCAHGIWYRITLKWHMNPNKTAMMATCREPALAKCPCHKGTPETNGSRKVEGQNKIVSTLDQWISINYWLLMWPYFTWL